MPTLQIRDGKVLRSADGKLAGSCCCHGGWFDVWQQGDVPRADENFAEVRYATILPINYVDFAFPPPPASGPLATSGTYNSWTSKGFSTHPTTSVRTRIGSVYHVQNGVWCVEEIRGDIPSSSPLLLSCYAPTGEQRFSQTLDPAWTGTPLDRDADLDGIPIGYFGISTVLAHTNPGGLYPWYLEQVVDLYNGGVVVLNTIDTPHATVPVFTGFDDLVLGIPHRGPSVGTLAKSFTLHQIETGGQHSDWNVLPTYHAISRSILSDTSVPSNPIGTSPGPDFPPILITCAGDGSGHSTSYWGGQTWDLYGDATSFIPCAQVVETITEAVVAFPFQGFPSACGISFNEINGFTLAGPGSHCHLPSGAGPMDYGEGYGTGDTRTHAMFLELKVGMLTRNAHWLSVEGPAAIRIDYTATYNDGVETDIDFQNYLDRVYPIYGEWLCFDARGRLGGPVASLPPGGGNSPSEDHWAGVVRYDNVPTYTQIGGALTSPPAPARTYPTRTSKIALLIDGFKAIEFTFPGLDLPWEAHNHYGYLGYHGQSLNINGGANVQLGIGEPYVCMHGIVAVIRKVYAVAPSGANPEGALLNTLKPWAFCLYQQAIEVWRSPLLVTPPIFSGYSPRWIYFISDDDDVQDFEMTGGQFQDRVFADPLNPPSRGWIINYNGTEVIPQGVLTDDPTVMTSVQQTFPKEQGGPFPYKIFCANDKHTLPATFAAMFANRYGK